MTRTDPATPAAAMLSPQAAAQSAAIARLLGRLRTGLGYQPARVPPAAPPPAASPFAAPPSAAPPSAPR